MLKFETAIASLLKQARSHMEARLQDFRSESCILFFSVSDGLTRAHVYRSAGESFEKAWQEGVAQCLEGIKRHQLAARWLRVDRVKEVEALTWGALEERLALTKRNYFRVGLALDPDLTYAFLEPELNANAMLYMGSSKVSAGLNQKNFSVYAQRRFGKDVPLDFDPERPVYLFTHEGLFVSDDDALLALPQGDEPVWLPSIDKPSMRWRDPSALNAGRRQITPLQQKHVYALVESSSEFLAQQVQDSGQFIYGHFPCFGRLIPTYNSLRHASSVYSMLEAWELSRSDALMDAIRKALTYLTKTIIRRYPRVDGAALAYNVDANGEIKLGANAVSLLALVKYDELTGDTQYRPLMESLALGIARMQNPDTGSFVHVLNAEDLSLKEAFRIVYYDGEAAFGLMRLYGLTADSRWLNIVERAFDYFIAAEHWKHHDHWLSYCANELTLHKPEEKYFRFGVQNVAGYLDFILTRETTYPTLLELSMAFEAMLRRIHEQHPEMRHVLEGLDVEKFHRALHHRAHYLLNGFFWPELAMFFAKPNSIVGSFFIRHHSFRVRIDDVEHYLSGYVAYWKFLGRNAPTAEDAATMPATPAHASFDEPALSVRETGTIQARVTWGGDVNLGRRQHYRTATLGISQVLRIPAFDHADLRVVNLECAVSTRGEQGVDKGEGGPYYYRARPDMLRVLIDAGINVVATANNHSGDYGSEALLEQAKWLDAVGLGHAGSGPSREAAFAPVLRRAGDLNVAIFSIDATQHRFAATEERPGSAYLPLTHPEAWKAEMSPRIAAARQSAHVVLVAVHWGANNVATPEANQVAAGHALIDAGADAVLGASAHVLQGVEVYRQRPIIYDAGDLLFDSVRRSPARAGVFSLEISANGVEQLRFVPIGVGFANSQQLSGEEAVTAVRDFAGLCRDLGTTLSVHADGTGTVELSPPRRPFKWLVPAPAAALDASALAPERMAGYVAGAVAPTWTVDEVPPDARIEPKSIGPLKLVGCRVHPAKFTRRSMLWVESFWTCDAPVSDDLRLDFRAIPSRKTLMKAWGRSMDHDPCDWLMPTSLWQPGVIYRDYYGLRPPYVDEWENCELRLWAGLVSDQGSTNMTALPLTVELKLPGKDSSSVSADGSGASFQGSFAYRTEFPDVVNTCLPGQTWTAEQLEAVTGGQWLVRPPQGWFVRSVVAGAKHIGLVESPTLFIGHDSMDRHRHEQSKLPQSNFDRHAVIPQQIGRLAGAIISNPVIAKQLPPDFPLLQVADPIRTFIELGIAARQRYEGDVIAITGTVGKSTTVDMVQELLGGNEGVLASIDNYNSRVGAPARLASLRPDYDAAVIEVAQSALWMNRGPITRLIRPTVAVITEIGLSQTSTRIKSIDDVAKWKSRVFDGLTGSAIAVVGEHLPCYEYVLEQAQRYAKRIVIFGKSESADVRIRQVDADEDGSWVGLELPGEEIRFWVPLPGMGMVYNAVAAVSVVHALGRDIRTSVERLQYLKAGEGRLQKQLLHINGGRVHVIDDSFNAEVASMVNALSVFGVMNPEREGRKIAVLGRIIHLGRMARTLHESLAGPVVHAGVNQVVTHGEEMNYLRAVLPEGLLGPHFSDAPSLVGYLRQALQDGDQVLIKGSRRDSDFGSIFRLLEAEAE